MSYGQVPGAVRTTPSPDMDPGSAAAQALHAADDLVQVAEALTGRLAAVVECLSGPFPQAVPDGPKAAPVLGFFGRLDDAHSATRSRLERLANLLASLEALTR